MKGFAYLYCALACIAAVSCQDTTAAFIAGDGDFGSVCVGDFHDLDVSFLCVIEGSDNECFIQSIMLSSTEFQLPQIVEDGGPISFPSDYQVNEDSYITFPLRYRPTSTGYHTGTLTISNDDGVENVLNLRGFSGEGSLEVAFDGDYGEVCVGDFRDLDMSILNTGNCSAIITDITTTGTLFDVVLGIFYPLNIPAGSSFTIPVRYTPTATGTDTDNLVISASIGGVADPIDFSVIGEVPPPILRAAIVDSGDFGEVCEGDFRDLDLTILNQGHCDLTITSVALTAAQVNYLFPSDLDFNVILSTGSDIQLPIRFSPTDLTISNDVILRIASDDQGDVSSTFDIDLTGSIPLPDMQVAMRIVDPLEMSVLESAQIWT